MLQIVVRSHACPSTHLHLLLESVQASYTAPPVLPLTAEGKKPAVPGLVLLDASSKTAAQALPVPRKKDEFTATFIGEWLNSVGLEVTIEPEPDVDDDKEYSPDDEEGYGGHDHDDYPGAYDD